jgi:hypothetical protein
MNRKDYEKEAYEAGIFQHDLRKAFFNRIEEHLHLAGVLKVAAVYASHPNF